ncbi:hypothetical protein AAFN85_12005 [Mucilaginibacter sp. CAU 1740]|uniref:hypothetical protein n=1 Tax=Mucilaginibacter sp. CAU 1740 TaxID=3140365 RepID=UPI00325A9F1F
MKTYTIKNTNGITINEFYQCIDNGGKIVIYGYCISVIAFTYRLISPPHLIRVGESQAKFKKHYNTLSLLFGWWGFPWGPIYTIDMIKINRKNRGGVDVTDEVLLKVAEKYAEGNYDEVFAEGIVVEYGDGELTR